MRAISRLFNHRAVPYRATTASDEFNDRVKAWAPVADGTPDGLNARPDQGWSGAQQDHGPGEQQGAKRRWYLHRSVDVAERDILSVESGPEAPVLLRVESVTKPTRRGTRVHHIEVNVEVWNGNLEAAP